MNARDFGPSVPAVQMTGPVDLDDPSEVRRTLQRCPPCIGNCLQGRACPAHCQFSDLDKPEPERSPWSTDDFVGSVALVIFCALIALITWGIA